MHSKEPVTQELVVLGTYGSWNKSGRIKAGRSVKKLISRSSPFTCRAGNLLSSLLTCVSARQMNVASLIWEGKLEYLWSELKFRVLYQKMRKLRGNLVTKCICHPMDGRPRPLCPWGFSSKNTQVACYALLQGIIPIEGSNPGLLHCRQILYNRSHKGSPIISPESQNWKL